MIHAHLAAAGGGSFNFHGGGGGGKGAGLYILIQILIRIVIFGHGLGALVIIAVILAWLAFTKLAPSMRGFTAGQEERGPSATRKTRERARRVELAAAEASDEDPSFAPETVKSQATGLFKAIEVAWDANDRSRLRTLVGPDLLAEWNLRLDDFERRGWRNRVKLLGEPAIEYVGLENRGNAAENRVTVRIEARLRDYVEDAYGNHLKRDGRLSEVVPFREYWTLGKGAHGGWILISIEQGAEGAHALKDQLVATPWSDDQALRDQSLLELAKADAVPEGTQISEVADLNFTGDARAAALDLSLADGRFAPDVLEVAVRRATRAWANAVDGDDTALQAIASPDAVTALLHPGDPTGRTRLVVRGPQVRQMRVTGLDAGAVPPTMTVEVDLEGRRYIEDRNTTELLSGSRSAPRRFTERWTFALDGDAEQPWRIAAAGAPVARPRA